MTEVPMWWLVISAIFFVINIFFFIGLIVALVKIVEVLKAMVPKVNAIGERVESIATKVEELAESAKGTVDSVGGRAKSVAGSVDMIAHTASQAFEKFAPYIAGALTGLKLLKAYREAHAGVPVSQATTKKVLDEGKDKEIVVVKDGRKKR